MRRSSSELCAAAVMLSLAIGVPAIAQDAEALVAEGLALRREGRDADAADRFRAAHEIGGGVRALAQLGLAEQALGRWLDAEEHLAAALEIDDPWIARHAPTLRESLETARQHLGDVLVEGNIEGASVLFNGREVGTLPLTDTVRAEAGTVVVEARADGYFPMQRQVDVIAGETARVQLALVARAREIEVVRTEIQSVEPRERQATLDSTPTLLDAESDYWLGAGIASVGVAVVSLIAMFVALYVREINAVYYATCEPTDRDRDPTCAAVGDRARGAEAASIGFGVVLGVTGGAGIGMTVHATRSF